MSSNKEHLKKIEEILNGYNVAEVYSTGITIASGAVELLTDRENAEAYAKEATELLNKYLWIYLQRRRQENA